jgi:membrane protease subunit (stomatin/prohibitin family)
MMGMGMGMMGSPLMTGLMAGGLGYMLGSSAANQRYPVQQAAPAYPAYPTYPAPQPTQAPQPAATPSSSPDAGKLEQLKMLGELHDRGVLTDGEFDSEKRRLLNS